jgi:deoxyribodipyrimidine photo-lyase
MPHSDPTPTLHWFRRDLRLCDNPALEWLEEQGSPALFVYIHAPQEEAPWEPGGASRWWLHQSLAALAEALEARGHPLLFARENSAAALIRICQQQGIRRVTWNHRHEPHLAARDQRVAAELAANGIEACPWEDGALFTPGTLRNRQQAPYRVFTPFWREARSRLGGLGLAHTQASPATIPPLPIQGRVTRELGSLELLDPHPWHQKLNSHHSPGEAGAHEHLDRFIADRLLTYAEAREIPAVAGSSRLSAHLHFGEIDIRRAVATTLAVVEAQPAKSGGGERFLAELGWREFARHILHHFPHSDRESLNPRFNQRMWQSDPEGLARWQRGETGIPLVDAGMRELWETGWMHNRVRMVVGSLLTKNLGIHWLDGARWFWDTLVDADLASNSLGWQWIAGCGVDAAPYFRIFNPETQAQRFDPRGEYIERWLGRDRLIPPIVDLKESRRLALERYSAHVKGNKP